MKRFSDMFLDEIRERVPISEIIGENAAKSVRFVVQKTNAPGAVTPRRVLTEPDHRRIEMAAESVCKIDDCCKPAYCKGLCRRHYDRLWRNGDPLAGNASPGAAACWIDEVATVYEGDDCLKWPFGGAGGGYGRTWAKGRQQLAHRVICERVHGEPPTPMHEAAHSCGNGHLGCVNPHHLSWKTPKDNQADRVLHETDNRGTRAYLAKLTEPDVREIRASEGQLSAKELAAKYGVTKENIRQILRRKTWAWLDDA